MIGIDVGLLLSHSCFLACLCFVFTLDCVSDLIEGLLVGDLAGDAKLLQAFLADLEEGRAETLVHPRPRLNDLAIIFLLLCYGDIAVSIHLPIFANIGKLSGSISIYVGGHCFVCSRDPASGPDRRKTKTYIRA